VTEDVAPAEAATRRRELGRHGFAQRSDLYRSSRPGYPPSLIEALVAEAGLDATSRVLDLASGTGSLSQMVAVHPRTGRVVAVEPSSSMRHEARTAVPGVPVIGGAAEALPLAAGSVAAAVVGQAFHWFDPDTALSELHRVLDPAGTVLLVWNERDQRVPWVAELGALLHDGGRNAHPAPDHFGAILDGDHRFTGFRRWAEPFVTPPMGVDQLVALAASRSYVNVLGDPERRRLLEAVERLARTLAPPIEFPYVTIGFFAHAVGPA
jgi:SAM-dependent methyltransferase